MLRTCLLIGLLSAFGSVLAAGDEIEILQSAAQAYDAGDFERAANLYRQLTDAGYEHPDIFYNLGNCYYRLAKPGPAILYYERAYKQKPKARDILQNLTIAQSLVEDPVIPIEPFFLRQWFEKFRDTFSSGNWGLISVLMVCLCITLLTMRLWQKAPPSFPALLGASILLLALSLVCGMSRYQAENATQAAILMAPEIELRTAADADSPPVQQIHEGEKIYILDQIGEWYKIRLVNMEEGWLPGSTFERI